MKTKLLVFFSLIFIMTAYTYYQSKKIVSFSSAINVSILKDLPDTALKTLNGEPTSLHRVLINNQSKLILVHFWGTWCGPCETEMPGLIEFVKKFNLVDLKIIFVTSNDTKQKIEKFFLKYGPLPDKITILLDNEDGYLNTFGSTRVPETFLFNSHKLLIKQFTGPQDWGNPYYLGLFQELSK